MDNVINQTTLIKTKNATVIFGKELSGTLSGSHVLIGCTGETTARNGSFSLIQCPDLTVTVDGASVLRDGYAIGDYVFVDDYNPVARYGGYWEEIAAGTFLMAAGAGGTVGRTGGEATHTLTVDEMPAHDGHIYNTKDQSVPYNIGTAKKSFLSYGTLASLSDLADVGRGWNIVSGNEAYPACFEKGGSQAHNNLPPYRTTHIYRRIKNPNNTKQE